MALSIIGTIASIVGILYFGLYGVNYYFYRPAVSIRYGGQEMWPSVPVPLDGRVPFATISGSSHRTKLTSVRVLYDPTTVDLSSTKGAVERLSVENDFPASIDFDDDAGATIVKNHILGNFFDFSSKAQVFAVKFEVTAETDPAELPFLVSMFSPRRERFDQEVTFSTDINVVPDLKKYGLEIRPGECVETTGIQAHEGVSCVAETGQVKVKVLEVTKH